MDWWVAGNKWLCDMATNHYLAWRHSKEGKRWNGKGSPYRAGYRQPDWMEDARQALGNNDEEAFKCIKLAHLEE